MKNTRILKSVLWTLTALLSFSQVAGQMNHTSFEALLKEYVTENGSVDYKGLKVADEKLVGYLGELESNQPEEGWSDDAKKAYWMNAYNAYTLKLMIDHYPLESITDLEEPWDKKWIQLNHPNDPKSELMSLNDIEHGVLRSSFKDPRIHAGINCASESCPPLANKAFSEENCEELLQELMIQFVNDPVRNSLSPKKVALSQIFEWFQGDFTQEGKRSLVEFLNEYSAVEIDRKAKISYLEYDWSINGK